VSPGVNFDASEPYRLALSPLASIVTPIPWAAIQRQRYVLRRRSPGHHDGKSLINLNAIGVPQTKVLQLHALLVRVSCRSTLPNQTRSRATVTFAPQAERLGRAARFQAHVVLPPRSSSRNISVQPAPMGCWPRRIPRAIQNTCYSSCSSLCCMHSIPAWASRVPSAPSQSCDNRCAAPYPPRKDRQQRNIPCRAR